MSPIEDGGLLDPIVDDEPPTGVNAWLKIVKPGLDAGKTPTEIAKDEGREVSYIEGVIQEWTEYGPILFRETVGEVERLVEFQKPAHSRICALYVFQSYFYHDLYPAVFYIAFESGLHGTGKTTATRIVTGLCRGGIMAGGLTLSAVERYLGEGRTLGVDEIDELPSDIGPTIQKSLRHGYERGAISIKSEQDIKAKWQPKSFNIFAPKGFNFRRKIDEALLSRTAVIQMARVKEEAMVDQVGDNLEYILDPNRAKFLAKLQRFADARLQEWNVERVRDTLKSHAFRDRVRMLAGTSPTPRDVQLSFIALLTADIVGVDIVQEWTATLDGSADYQTDGEVDDLRRDVSSRFQKLSVGDYILSSDLRVAVNAERAARKDEIIKPRAWPDLLGKLDLRRGSELKRVPGEGNHAVYFTEHAKRVLFPVTSHAGLFGFTEASQPADFREVREVTDFTDVKSQEEGVKLLYDVCEECREVSEDGSFTVDDIVKSPRAPPREVVERWFRRWIEEGKIYAPREGRYRLV